MWRDRGGASLGALAFSRDTGYDGFMTSTSIRTILGNRPVHEVTPETRLRAVARLMAEQRVGAVAVVQDDALLGVLSERDIVFRAVAQGLSVDDTEARAVMTPDPVTLDIDAPVSEALARHLGDAFRHLPVLAEGRLVGLLSYRDIPAEYVMMFEHFREMSAARADEGT